MKKWVPLTAVCLGSLLLMVDVTIVNVALPQMTTDLSASFASLQWVIDAYALTLAVLLLAIGALSDTYGHRRLFLAGLAVFVLASIACGLAPDAPLLVGARAVQGVGGAAMFATTFALLNAAYRGRDRGTAYGVFGAVSGGAAALGPVVGGLLTQGLSWRWIFFVNVPLGLLTLLLTVATVPISAGRPRRPDLAGTATFTIAAAAITYALIRSSDLGWTSWTVLGLLAVGVLALLAFLAVETRATHPLVRPAFLREGAFSATVLAALVLSFSAFGMLTFTTVWTQTMLGLSPLESGLVALPLPVLSAGVSLLSGHWMDRVPRHLSIGGGVVVIGIGGLLSAHLVTAEAGWVSLLPGLALSGIGCGIAVPALSRTATESVGDQNAGMASGAVNTARQLGQVFGIALLGSLLAAAASSSLTSAGLGRPAATARELVGGGAASVLARTGSGHDDLERALHSAFASGLDLGFLVAGCLAVATGLLVTHMLRRGRTRRPHGTHAGSGEPQHRAGLVHG